EPAAAGQRAARPLPVEPSPDHKMSHGIDVTVEPDHDALAETAEPADHPARELGRRRLGGAQHKRTADPDPLEGSADDPRLEGFQIDDDVRQLGHEREVYSFLTPRCPRGPHPLSRSPFGRGGTADRRMLIAEAFTAEVAESAEMGVN